MLMLVPYSKAYKFLQTARPSVTGKYSASCTLIEQACSGTAVWIEVLLKVPACQIQCAVQLTSETAKGLQGDRSHV